MKTNGITFAPRGTDTLEIKAAPRVNSEKRSNARLVLSRAVFLFAGVLATSPLHAQAPGAPMRAPRAGPGAEPEMELVDRFDKDANGRLDTAERAVAREWLAANAPTTGPRGGGGGFGSQGGFGPPGAFDPAGGPPPPELRRPDGGRAGRGTPGGPRGPGGMGGPGGPGRFTMATGTPGAKLDPAEVTSYSAAPLYDPGTLRTIFIDFANDEWEQELAAFYNTDVEVPATVTVDGRRYENVGVHFRGMSSFRMVPAGSKRSLNLAFDFVKDDQRVGGYKTLNLLNANGDPTFMRAALYSDIARNYIAIPATNFVRVAINGETWGVYVNVQQFNKEFLADFFDTTEGARWKVPGSPNGRGGLEYLGDDVAAYRRLYDIKSGNDDASWAALINLTRVLNETPIAQLEQALEPILDIDETLKFLALENALVNSDGYWARASDYNLYLAPDGRFHVIPHDFNEALGAGGNARLDPLAAADDPSKPLLSRLLAVPALRERYLGYVDEIARTWLDWNRLEPLVQQYRSVISEAVQEDTRKLYRTEDFEPGIESLKQFVEQRRSFLLVQ